MRVCCRRVVITFQERRSLSDGEHEHQVEEQLRPADPLVRFTPPRQIAAGHLTRGLDRANREPSPRKHYPRLVESGVNRCELTPLAEGGAHVRFEIVPVRECSTCGQQGERRDRGRAHGEGRRWARRPGRRTCDEGWVGPERCRLVMATSSFAGPEQDGR